MVKTPRGNMKTAHEHQSSRHTGNTSKTILIVDDSKSLNRLIQKALQREGFQVLQAFDGADALTLAASHPDSIMLLDYVLPDMTALQVIEQLRAQAYDIPFIIMTGQGDERVAVDMMKLGAREYISKQGYFLETLPRILWRVISELDQQQRVIQAEQALRESERRFRETLENVDLIALMLDLDGRITFCNESLLRLLGRSRDEVLGQEWFAAFLPPEIQQSLKKSFLEELARGEIFVHHENEILCASGERRLITWSNIILRDLHGNIIGTNSLGEDITERKQSEQRQQLIAKILLWLNCTEEQTGIIQKILLLLKEFSGVDAVGIRLQHGEHFPYYKTNGSSESILLQEGPLCMSAENNNSRQNNIAHATAGCICGTVFSGNIDPTQPFFTKGGSFWVNDTYEFLQKMPQEEQLFCTHCYCVQSGYASVTLVPLRAGDNIIGLLQLNDSHKNKFTRESIEFFEEIGVSIGIAITRKQTKEHLLQLRKAIETMHLGVTISNLNRKIVYTNPADATMHGYTEEELIGQPASIFAPPKLRHPLTLEEVEKSRNWIRESTNIRKDGSCFPVQLSSDIVRDTDGQPIAIVTTCEDITERKRAEETMTQERNLLRTLIDNLPDHIFVKDIEGRFLINNMAHTQSLGATNPDEIIGTTIFDYLPKPLAQQEHKTDLTVLQSGVPVLNQEQEFITPQGQSEWRLVTKVPLRDHENTITGLVGICRDISEQKRTQNALEARTKELEERMKELNCLFQISHLTENETLSLEALLEQTVNLLPTAWKYPDIACARIRVYEKQFATQNFTETSWKQESQIAINNSVIGLVQVYYLTEQPAEYEGPFLLEERRLIDIVAERLGELIEKKRSEKAIRESRKFLQSTLDSLATHIAILDEQGTILEVNASWKDFASTNELDRKNYCIGENYLHICETAAREWSTGGPEAASGIRMVIAQERESFYLEYPSHSLSTQRWFAMRVTRFQNDDSVRIVIAHENITERKEAEEALQNTLNELEYRVQKRTAELVLLNERLERASRLKDEFLANMSHELRTPLNAILGYAQILRHADNLTEHQQEALTTVKNSGEHLLSMINEILDLSKIEAGQMTLQFTDMVLSTFLKSLTDMIRVRAEQKGIMFSYKPEPGLPEGIRADAKRLREVLLNLLGNAVKFTDQGSVTFRVTSCRECAAVNDANQQTVPRRFPFTQILFEVEDTGTGIAPEHTQEIFLPFHQIDEQHHGIEGTGLGLTISRKLVEMMGSELHLESTPGTGSRFWFAIDVEEIPGAVHQDELPLPRITGYAGAPKTVLVIDDVAENREILLSVLLPLGFRVVEATNGEEGIERTLRVQPDMILLDLFMPGMSGFEFARHIRGMQQLNHIAVIAISASTFKEIRQRSLKAGCDDFLGKPLQVDDLLKLLETYLHIEWTYKKDSALREGEEERVQDASEGWERIPVAAQEELFQQAERGNVKRILEVLNHLEERFGVEQPPIVAELKTLAKHFDVDRIVEFLETEKKAV